MFVCVFSVKYKTPRLGPYSKRHIRRLVQKRVEDVQQLSAENDSSDKDAEKCRKMFNDVLKIIDPCSSTSTDFQERSQKSDTQHCNEEVESLNRIDARSRDNLNTPLLLNESMTSSDNSDEDYLNLNIDLLGIIDDSSSDDEFTNMFTENVQNIPEEEKNCRKESEIKQELRDWALKFHITLVALTALLLLLRAVFHVNLPLDGRTLLGTLRKTEISGGTYHHFGLKRALSGILQEIKNKGEQPRDIKLILNIDSVPISKSGTDNVWMIMCSELSCSNVYPVGASYGKSKPKDANEFLTPFVEEAIFYCNNGFENSAIDVSVEAIVCDAPAKSYVFYLKGHTGYGSCSKCFTEGKSVLPETPKRGKKKKKRVCCPGIGPFKLRSDKDFSSETLSNKKTILADIPRFGCVSSVPLDYLHLILIGVTKKLIRLWFSGPSKVRLSPDKINKISEILLRLRATIPSEFNRHPRTLLEYKFWKGTEFRTFLLYSGVVALQNILEEKLYSHFLLLHTAVSILVSKTLLHDKRNIDYAHELLVAFVQKFSKLYGTEFMSHNIHNLLHICDDVKKYGELDNFSAFRFENYLSIIKRMIRTGNKPLEQIARRYSEMESSQNKQKKKDGELLLQQPHCSGPITQECLQTVNTQYKVLKSKNLRLNCNNAKDTCVLLNNGTFSVIENIVQFNNRICLIGKHLKFKTCLYEFPDSRQINIHVMDDYDKQLHVIPVDNVSAKVWRVPSSKGHIVMPLLHGC